MISIVTSQQEGSEFSCMSPQVRVGSLCFSQFKDLQVRLTDDSKLPVSINVSMSSLCEPCDRLATRAAPKYQNIS